MNLKITRKLFLKAPDEIFIVLAFICLLDQSPLLCISVANDFYDPLLICAPSWTSKTISSISSFQIKLVQNETDSAHLPIYICLR